MNYTNKCETCKNSSKFVLEWYSLNQYGENPEVIQEIEVCYRFRHMVEAMQSPNNLFGIIDGIVDSKTLDIEHPELTDLVNKAYYLKKDSLDYQRVCDEGQKRISKDIPVQLELF